MTHIHPPTSRPAVTRRVPPFLLAFLAAVVAASGAAYATHSGSLQTKGEATQVNNFLIDPCPGAAVGTKATNRTYDGDANVGTVTLNAVVFTAAPAGGAAHVSSEPGFSWDESGGFNNLSANGTVDPANNSGDCTTIRTIPRGFATVISADGTVSTSPATLDCTSAGGATNFNNGTYQRDGSKLTFTFAAAPCTITWATNRQPGNCDIKYELDHLLLGAVGYTGSITFHCA